MVFLPFPLLCPPDELARVLSERVHRMFTGSEMRNSGCGPGPRQERSTVLRVGGCQPLWTGHRSVASQWHSWVGCSPRHMMRLLDSPAGRANPGHLDVWDHRSSGGGRDRTHVNAIVVPCGPAIAQSRAHDAHGPGANRGTGCVCSARLPAGIIGHLDVWDHRSSGGGWDRTHVNAVNAPCGSAIAQSRANGTHGLGADHCT